MSAPPTNGTIPAAALERELLDLFAPMNRHRTSAIHAPSDQAALWRLDAIHRAKNLGQLSVSLANIAGNGPQRWSASEITSPARTLARTYEALAVDATDTNVVPCLDMIAEIATQLTYIFGKARGIQARIDGRDVHLSPAARRAMALACSELVINALKYAFPDGGPGRIVVQLLPSPSAIDLIVADDGIGLPAVSTRGLGTGLIDRLAAVSGATLHRGGGLDGVGHGVTMRIPAP